MTDDTPLRVATAAHEFLLSQLDDGGVPSARLCFDLDFLDVFSVAEARQRLRARLDVDTGLDLGDEGFSAMLTLALLPPQARTLVAVAARQVRSCQRGDRFCFFPGVAAFPADTDCTAVAAAGLYDHRLITFSDLVACARQILAATVPDPRDGLRARVVTVYWDDARPRRQDAVVGANALHALHIAAQASDRSPGHPVAEATLHYLADHLASGSYRHGTRYYPLSLAFLHAASRLCARAPTRTGALTASLRAALRSHPTPTRALDLALLILAEHELGRTEQPHRRALLAAMQRRDGSWPACPYFRLGRFPVYFGSAYLTTLFALRALQPRWNIP